MIGAVSRLLSCRPTSIVCTGADLPLPCAATDHDMELTHRCGVCINIVIVVIIAFCLRSRSSILGSDGSAVSVTTVHGTNCRCDTQLGAFRRLSVKVKVKRSACTP